MESFFKPEIFEHNIDEESRVWFTPKHQELIKEASIKKELEMLTFLKTGFRNEEDFKKYEFLWIKLKPVFNRFKGSDFSKEFVQKEFTKEIIKFLE